ncbi:MAG: hypothetical protein WCP46_00025 [Alphaproteobacteria bacterium]
MAKCLLDIKLDIIDEVRNTALDLGGFKRSSKDTLEITDAKEAATTSKKINDDFKEDIITPSVTSKTHYFIEPSDELSQQYLNKYNENELVGANQLKQDELNRGVTENGEGEFFQSKNIPSSVASEDTVKEVKKLMNKLGIKQVDLLQYAKENGLDVSDVNGLADIVKGIVAIADGREEQALTEEAIHIATAILEQTNPKLVTEMISKIDRFSIYKEVFDAYKDVYTTKDGKPDIRRIKKEAVDRLLVEVLINNQDGNTDFPELLKEENLSLVRQWWNKIMDWFRGSYKASNIQIFGEVANILKNDNIGTVADIKSGDVYLQQATEKQNEISSKLEATSKILNKEYAKDSDDDVLGAETEANNWYTLLVDGQWKKIEHRVTDRVKEFYNKIFRDKVFTKEEQERNNALRDYGIEVHDTIEGIINRIVDPTTHKFKSVIDPRPTVHTIRNDSNFEVYGKLEKYVFDLLRTFNKDSIIIPEKMILNPNIKAKKKDFANGEAGTLDLVIVEPSGKTHILDWKSMGINKEQKDLAAYKQNGFNIQIETYKQTLKNFYGVEKFGMTRAIPFMMDVVKAPSGNWVLKGLTVASADPTKIEELKLLPVPTESERTGIESIDLVLDRLQKVHSKIKGEKVEEEMKATKRDRLTILKRAMRIIQTTQNLEPLHDAMEVYEGQLLSTIERYEAIKDDVSKLTQAERNEISDEFLDVSELFNYYSKITIELEDVLDKNDALYKKILESQDNINKYQFRLNRAKQQYVDSIGQANNIFGLLLPEKVIRGAYKLFKSFDEYSNRAAQLIVTLYNKAQYEAVEKSTAFNTELMNIIKEINDKGLSYEKIRTEKNTLVSKLSPEFKKAFAEAEDKEKFVRENIRDLNAYTEEVNKIKQEKIDKIKNRTRLFPGEYEEINKKQEIEELENKYNPLKPVYINEVLLKHLKEEKWYSEEYKELNRPENAPLLAFYNKVLELNDIAEKSGYIEYKEKRKFLPFMEKSLMEKMGTNGWDVFSIPGQFIDSLNASEKAKYQYSEITGKRVSNLAKPFTNNIAKSFDSEGNVNFDYSKVSGQTGQAVILYAQAMFKYQAMSQIDEQIELLLQVEQLKSHIETDRWNNAVLVEDENTGEKKAMTAEGNTENAKTLSDFVQYLIYNNRYPLSQDVNLGTNAAINSMKRFMNKNFGTEFIETTTATSMIQTIDAINRGFQLKTLGLSPVSGVVNWFGANIQAMAQKDGYFTVLEFMKSQTKLSRMAQFTEKEGDVFIALSKLFNPFTENHNYHLFLEAHTNALGRFTFNNVLGVFMQKPEMLIQSAIFDSLLKNTMIVNGKIEQITAYVNSKYKDNRYDISLGKEGRDAINKKIEDEINDLKENKSIAATAEYKDGKLLIDGEEFTDKEQIQKLSMKSKSLYKRITGNVSETSVNQAKLDIFSSSMMVFKNWVPKLWYTRFGELAKVNDPFNANAYDVGRVKVLMSIPGGIIAKIQNINSILKGTDEGIRTLDDMYVEYAAKYKLNTGEDFKMDKSAFNDMIIQNLSNQMRELAILASLFSATLALGFVQPPDDDDRSKAALRITKRIVDQFVQELSFFYNPVEIQNMLSGGMFPALGMLSDMEKFVTHSTKELFGYDVSNPYRTPEEVRDSAHPIKMLWRLFPSSALMKFTTIIDPETAKDYGIELPQQTAQR